MNKAELINALNNFIEKQRATRCGQNIIVRHFANYIQKTSDDSSVDIIKKIPQLLYDMLCEAKYDFSSFYQEWELERGLPFPSLKKIGISDELYRQETVNLIAYIFKIIFGKNEIANKIKSKFNTELSTLQSRTSSFFVRVYDNGLRKIIKSSLFDDMYGIFGMTTFASHVDHSGQIGLTCMSNSDVLEDSFSFSYYDEDPIQTQAKILTVRTDIEMALEMINDVLDGWPDDPDDQAKLFVPILL